MPLLSPQSEREAIGRQLEAHTFPILSMRVAQTRRLDPSWFAAPEIGVRCMAEDFADNIVFQFTKRFVRGEPEVFETYKWVPKTWWDHLKKTMAERFRWLAPRLVWEFDRITVSTSKHYHLCPHIGVSNMDRHVKFLTTKPKEDFAYEENERRMFGVPQRPSYSLPR